MDTLELFLAAQSEFGTRVRAVADDQWQLDTPDSEWTVVDLVAHLVTEHRWAAPLLHGHDLETAGQIVAGSRSLPADGGVGANLAEEWEEAAVESADAFAAAGALDRSVALSRGETPVRDYIAEMTFDLVVHGWDLATAIAYPDPLPEDIVDAVFEFARTMGDLADTDLFAEPVAIADDAPAIDRLVALTGRDPR